MTLCTYNLMNWSNNMFMLLEDLIKFWFFIL